MTSNRSKPRKPTVRPSVWREGIHEAAVIKIFSGGQFVVIRYDEARRVVDEVHDLCDNRERTLRERKP